MKRLLTCLLAPTLAVAIGCNQDSTRGGPGIGTETGSNPVTANKPVIGEPEGTFELTVPLLATRIKQGETTQATISLRRGKNFEEDVTLNFGALPKGITVDPATIKKSDKEVKIDFHAAADAAIGEFSVKVIGHPTQGADATNSVKLDVVEK